MDPSEAIEDCIRSAVQKIDDFFFSATGTRSTQEEIANALNRYFVLKEILDFVVMERDAQHSTHQSPPVNE